MLWSEARKRRDFFFRSVFMFNCCSNSVFLFQTFLQVCEKDCSIRRLMGLFVIVYNVRVLDAGYRF